jgi:glycosyltransferase involved in cell wall biosynthesis
MTELKRVAFIGNSLPRRCGIATFTTDLQQAVAASRPSLRASIVAMNDDGRTYDYSSDVDFVVQDEAVDSYIRAAEHLNAGQVDVVSLQHEFGIFGGDAGGHVLELLRRLNMPIVTTLHTVLANPSAVQRDVLEQIIAASSKVIVMAEKGRELLDTVYAAPGKKVEIIPHGIPDFPFVEPDKGKAELGFGDSAIILTFGLLSPNKGVEVMIDAMPAILKRRPDALYVVLGATHPKLVRHQGEAYRESLMARAKALGVHEHVLFRDQFVDQATLLSYIAMCDVYAAPYLNEAQMTSGTLAYSVGLGRAVVSTPYWHARELLADGRGALVPFGDSLAIGAEIAGLLTDDARRKAMQARAYTSTRSMTWDRTAERYLGVFEAARRAHRSGVVAQLGRGARDAHALPQLRIDYLLSMCDDTGLFQHAVHSVPNRAHGYCVDDNARALMLSSKLDEFGELRLPGALTGQLAAFVQHAWNPDTQRFRNFMSFDRRWLEESGSEDSHGRTLWALGVCAHEDSCSVRRAWAAALFAEALPAVERFTSPRAWAFTLLGLDAYCAAFTEDAGAYRLRIVLADRLVAILSAVETRDWIWFEEGLSYDNARLCQALIETGKATDCDKYLDAGLRTLRWLMKLQTAPAGHFRPVGSQSFGDLRMAPKAFDQQPLEATAAISACLAAWAADGDSQWKLDAARAFAWFSGKNDLATPLVDPDKGDCCDGLHRDRPNENRGGESVISYLLSLAELRHLAREQDARTVISAKSASRA